MTRGRRKRLQLSLEEEEKPNLLVDFEDYLYSENKSPGTVEMYSSIVKTFLRKLEGDGRSLEDIDTVYVKSYLGGLRRKGYSGSALLVATCALKKFLEYCGRSDIASELKLPRVERKIPDVLTAEEVQAMVKKAHSLRDKLVVLLLFYGALRVSELCNLKVEDVGVLDDPTELRIFGKGGKERKVYIPKWVAEMLYEWIRLRKKRRGDRVFKLARNTVFMIVKRLAKRARIKKKVSPHTLRHSYATILYRKTRNIRLVQQYLGHSKITTTEIYTHVAGIEIRDAVVSVDTDIHKTFLGGKSE